MLSSLLTCCWNTWSRMQCSNNIISLLTWATVLPPTMPCHYLYDFFTHSMPTYMYRSVFLLSQLHFLYHFVWYFVCECVQVLSTYFFVLYRKLSFFLSIFSLSPYLHYILLLSLLESPYIFLGSLLIVKSGNYCWCDVVVAAAALQKNYGFSYFGKKEKAQWCGVVWCGRAAHLRRLLDWMNEWKEMLLPLPFAAHSLSLSLQLSIYHTTDCDWEKNFLCPSHSVLEKNCWCTNYFSEVKIRKFGLAT